MYDGTLTAQAQTNTNSEFQSAYTPDNSTAANDNVHVSPGPSNSSNVYDVAQVTSDERVYDVANVPRGGDYSVLNRSGGADPYPNEYNVLVHNGDHSDKPTPQFPTEEYSKLQV